MWLNLFAVIAGLSGTGCLYLAWKKQFVYAAVICAVVLLFASTYLWVRTLGTEFGVVFGLFLPALYACVWILLSVEKRSGKSNEKRFHQVRLERRKVFRNTGIFIFAIPVTAIATTYIVTAGSLLIPVHEVNQIVLAIASLPVVWAILAYWFYIDQRRLRPVVSILILALASGVFLINTAQ